MKIHPLEQQDRFKVRSEADDAYTNEIKGGIAVSFKGRLVDKGQAVRVVAFNPKEELATKIEKLRYGMTFYAIGKLKPAENPAYADNLTIKDIEFEDAPASKDEFLNDKIPF